MSQINSQMSGKCSPERDETTCVASTIESTSRDVNGSDDAASFTRPLVSVREKLRFPLKFEKKSFCLDFTSTDGFASTSDCEPTSLR